MNIINAPVAKFNSWTLAHRGPQQRNRCDFSGLKREDRRQERRVLNAGLKHIGLEDLREDMGMLFMPVQKVVEPVVETEPSHSVSYDVKVTRKAKFQRAIQDVVVVTVQSLS